MAYFKCTGGLNPTGNAAVGDVKSGMTFSNANGIDLVGTFAAQEKTVTSSRTAQTVTPDSGKYLSKVTVNALAPTGTYNATSRGTNIDMGATSNYRYVTTTSVPNTNSGTYTYEWSGGETRDLGETNTYRYVNASNVYNCGYSNALGSALVIAGIFTTSASFGYITCATTYDVVNHVFYHDWVNQLYPSSTACPMYANAVSGNGELKFNSAGYYKYWRLGGYGAVNPITSDTSQSYPTSGIDTGTTAYANAGATVTLSGAGYHYIVAFYGGTNPG